VLSVTELNSRVTHRNHSHRLQTGRWSGSDARNGRGALCAVICPCFLSDWQLAMLHSQCSALHYWGDGGVVSLMSLGGFGGSAGCHSAQTQGSGLPCVHYSAQHDLLGSADGLQAPFSSQARTTEP